MIYIATEEIVPFSAKYKPGPLVYDELMQWAVLNLVVLAHCLFLFSQVVDSTSIPPPRGHFDTWKYRRFVSVCYTSRRGKTRRI